MIPFNHRFHGHNSLRYVYKNGEALRSRVVTIKYSRNPHRKQSRIAVVISKKVLKSAVGRNRARRRVYEIMRHELSHISKPTDIVILLFSSEVATMSHDELRENIMTLLEQVETYQKPSKNDILPPVFSTETTE